MVQDRKKWSRTCKQCHAPESGICATDQSNPVLLFLACVGVPLGGKVTLQDTKGFVMARINKRAIDRWYPPMNACVGELFVGKETSPDTPAFVLTLIHEYH